ncbi:MAG: hypothetical protein PHU85_10420 [Phycisphaerae bacterium]|nr:hypothetical protein [Phycisphaerae bacterium]
MMPGSQILDFDGKMKFHADGSRALLPSLNMVIALTAGGPCANAILGTMALLDVTASGGAWTWNFFGVGGSCKLHYAEAFGTWGFQYGSENCWSAVAGLSFNADCRLSGVGTTVYNHVGLEAFCPDGTTLSLTVECP